MTDQAEVKSGEHGIKETGEVIVGAFAVAAEIIRQVKDEGGLVEDVMDIIDKFKSDDVFKGKLEAMIKDIGKVPDEVKDLQLNEGFALGAIALAELPKLIEELQK